MLISQLKGRMLYTRYIIWLIGLFSQNVYFSFKGGAICNSKKIIRVRESMRPDGPKNATGRSDDSNFRSTESPLVYFKARTVHVPVPITLKDIIIIVPIFWTRPVLQNHKIPYFLDSLFLGEALYFRKPFTFSPKTYSFHTKTVYFQYGRYTIHITRDKRTRTHWFRKKISNTNEHEHGFVTKSNMNTEHRTNIERL